LEARDSFLLSDVQIGYATNQVVGALWAEVKRPANEFDHLPPGSAEAKNAWMYAATSLYAFMAWTGRNLLLCYVSHFLNVIHFRCFF